MKKWITLFFTFLKIGAFTFGGGYAMVALLENELIAKKKWLDKDEFLDMVAIAESTPGPVAINSATYIGYRIGGVPGAAGATLAVCIPSFLIVYLISLFFDQFLRLQLVVRAFRGIQVGVVYLIFSAGIKMGKSLPKTARNRVILIAVLIGMTGCTLCAVSFSSVYYILICGALGLLTEWIHRLQAKEAARK